ncbi:MAG TPA: hypothetical protein VKA38_12700, partial [Draconibacterium sp.]|nr:hypothetical protein [Draconibacterium sp.]
KHYKEMKKIIVLVMATAVLTIFNGCQKEELNIRRLTDDEVQPQEVVKPDVYVENGYLAFANMNAVDSVISMLNGMTTLEKEDWEKQMGFKSARAEFDALFEEYDKLESYEAFLQFKERNAGKFKFNENDPNDCSIDYPFAAGYFLPILSMEGIYKAGKSIVKYTMEDQIVIADGDINKLKNLNAFMDDDMVFVLSKLKSGSYSTNGIHWFPEDDPSGNESVWHTKPGISDRRINHQLMSYQWLIWESANVWRNGYRIYLNQRGQKHSWGKWRDYNTTYGIKEIKCKVGSATTYEDIRSHISAEVKPSINFYLYYYEQVTSYAPSGFLTIPSVSFAANVTFRGFGFNATDYYTIENPESYTPAGTNNYPPSNWGW